MRELIKGEIAPYYETDDTMLDATKIPIDDIAEINGEIFCSLENPD